MKQEIQLTIDMGTITVDDWGTTLNDCIANVIESTLGAAITRMVNDALKQRRGKLEKSIEKWLDEEIGHISDPTELRARIEELRRKKIRQ